MMYSIVLLKYSSPPLSKDMKFVKLFNLSVFQYPCCEESCRKSRCLFLVNIGANLLQETYMYAQLESGCLSHKSISQQANENLLAMPSMVTEPPCQCRTFSNIHHSRVA